MKLNLLKVEVAKIEDQISMRFGKSVNVLIFYSEPLRYKRQCARDLKLALSQYVKRRILYLSWNS